MSRQVWWCVDRKNRTHPRESDGGREGQASVMGVVPSEETSSWVNG